MATKNRKLSTLFLLGIIFGLHLSALMKHKLDFFFIDTYLLLSGGGIEQYFNVLLSMALMFFFTHTVKTGSWKIMILE